MTLPWLAAPLAEALAHRRGHALLVHGAAGQGALEFVMALAQAQLCESPRSERPASGLACGRCASCHLFGNHGHPDLFVLLPETLRQQLAWPLPEDKGESESASKTKPSKQIRIDDMRWLVDRLQRTSGRGRGKVALIHPAQAMNETAANALLKTLEEPAAGTTLLLTVSDPARLLPTVRSRCQWLRLPLPDKAQGLQWLAEQSVPGAEVLLAAAGGLPLDALALHQRGVDAASWQSLPRAVAAGLPSAAATLAPWGASRAIETLLVLCHDALAVSLGAAPRFFPASCLPSEAAPHRLQAWQTTLQRVARHAEHPWNENLLLDTLLAQGREALRPLRSAPGGTGGPDRDPLATPRP
jgi:DNA polymerase-3 subunit delta'